MKTLAERPGYKWVIAAVCFLTVTIALGFFYNTLSLFLKAVTEELNIPRSLYAATSLSSTCASVLIGAIFGKLAGRVRTKTMLLFAVSEMFGERCYAKIMGLYFGLLCVAYAVGDLLTNGLFDRIGSYRPILFVYAGVMLLFTVAEPIIFAYGRKERAAIAAAEYRKEGTER